MVGASRYHLEKLPRIDIHDIEFALLLEFEHLVWTAVRCFNGRNKAHVVRHLVRRVRRGVMFT
jgi:hypothetical protein